MQTANVMVHIGGDHGNQVPKLVTAAEIAVLRLIHGDDAVTDIDPLEDDNGLNNRDELARLRGIYTTRDGEGRPLINLLFPGAGARVFETIDELGLSDSLFKPTARANAKAPEEPAPEKAATKAKKGKAAVEPETPAAPVKDDDAEVADMPDADEDLFK